MLEKFSMEELKILEMFLGEQDPCEVRNIIEKYKLPLNRVKVEVLMSSLYDEIMREIERKQKLKRNQMNLGSVVSKTVCSRCSSLLEILENQESIRCPYCNKLIDLKFNVEGEQ